MPTQKNKLKKVKSEPTPTPAAPVQIKAEPLGIKPLGAYVDDRVELIRQAFTCLKPKEVKCLVPDFLEGKSIEFIQEQCLDELLGISTKRLLSIINNTKCPTDTESEEEDEKIVEHISLDEISSDSDVEIPKPLAKKVKPKHAKAKKAKESEVKTNDKPNKNGGKKSEKEMTVLELLELQARARAIRSQLALEPVTKIELDSDQEGENASDADKVSDKQTSKKGKSDTTDSAKQSKKSSPKEKQSKDQPKRVRLKRNFRIRQVGDEDPPEETSQSSIPEPQPVRKSRSKSKEKEPEPKQPVVEEQTKPKEEAQESKSRDSSPEVIPVIPSPETLCISSDSEDEKAKKAKSSIFVDNIEELEKQLKENQIQAPPAAKPDHKDEPEEGELTEEDKSPKRSRKESVRSIGTNSEKAAVESPKKTASLDQEEELDYEVREISDSEPEASNQGKNDSTKTEKEEVEIEAEDGNDSDESEPESDSTEDEANDKSSSDDDDDHDPDVVEIHDSSDETLLEQKLAEDDTEKSWGSRWLESKRVAKVMAASRLGNKVRDKLKKKKQKEQQQQELEKEATKAESPEPPKEPEIPTNVEEGSVEHYKELVAKAGGTEAAPKEKDDTDAAEGNDN